MVAWRALPALRLTASRSCASATGWRPARESMNPSVSSVSACSPGGAWLRRCSTSTSRSVAAAASGWRTLASSASAWRVARLPCAGNPSSPCSTACAACSVRSASSRRPCSCSRRPSVRSKVARVCGACGKASSARPAARRISSSTLVGVVRPPSLPAACNNSTRKSLHRLRAQRLGLRLVRLAGRVPGRQRKGCDQQQQRGAAQRVPAQPTLRAVAAGGRAHAHRQAFEMALDVERERCHRRITTTGFGLQCGVDDRLQVAAHGARQCAGARVARVQQCRGDVARCAGQRDRPLRADADQQLMQQHAERVDVHRSAHDAAVELFRRGVGWRHPPRRGLRRRRRVVEHARDAEVEQLHLAVVVDQDVAGLEVAVDHQVAVRVLDRRADVEKQPQARRHAESPGIAPAVDRQPVDVFEHQIGRTLGTDAAIDQPRDRRMRQSRQQLPFAGEARAFAGIEHAAAQQLDGHALFEGAIGAFAEIDAGAAAGSDRSQHAPRTQPALPAVLGRIDARQQIGVEHAGRVGRGQQLLHQRSEFAIQWLRGEPVRARFGRQVEQRIEQRRGLRPAPLQQLGAGATLSHPRYCASSMRAFCHRRSTLRGAIPSSSATRGTGRPAK